MLRLGNHYKYNIPVKKQKEKSKELVYFEKWKQEYKKDKTFYVYYYLYIIYPKNIYSLEKDNIQAEYWRKYFIKKCN